MNEAKTLWGSGGGGKEGETKIASPPQMPSLHKSGIRMSLRGRICIVFISAAVGIAICILGIILYKREKDDYETNLVRNFQSRAESYARSIESSMSISHETSRLITSYFVANSYSNPNSSYATQVAFNEFGSSFPDSVTAVTAFVWAPRVTLANAPSFINNAKREWNDSSLYLKDQNDNGNGVLVDVPATDRNVYFPFYLRVPWSDKVRPLLLVDFYLPRKDLIDNAVTSGNSYASEKFVLNAVGGVGIILFDASMPKALRGSNSSFEVKMNETLGVLISLLKLQGLTTSALKNTPPQQGESLYFFEANTSDYVPFSLGFNSSSANQWYELQWSRKSSLS